MVNEGTGNTSLPTTGDELVFYTNLKTCQLPLHHTLQDILALPTVRAVPGPPAGGVAVAACGEAAGTGVRTAVSGTGFHGAVPRWRAAGQPHDIRRRRRTRARLLLARHVPAPRQRAGSHNGPCHGAHLLHVGRLRRPPAGRSKAAHEEGWLRLQHNGHTAAAHPGPKRVLLPVPRVVPVGRRAGIPADTRRGRRCVVGGGHRLRGGPQRAATRPRPLRAASPEGAAREERGRGSNSLQLTRVAGDLSNGVGPAADTKSQEEPLNGIGGHHVTPM